MSSNKGLVCQCGGTIITNDNMTETEGHGDWWYQCDKCKTVYMDIAYYYNRAETAEASLSAMRSRLDGITVQELQNIIYKTKFKLAQGVRRDSNYTEHDIEIKIAEAIKTLIKEVKG